MGIGTSKRGKIYGVGYCSTNLKGSIKSINTHPYNVWKSMLERSYDPKFKLKNPAYTSVKVCSLWHDYQKFHDWYELNYYEIPGKKMNLDKDIRYHGNRLYSPENCAFVPQEINLLLTNCKRSRGSCPQGVSFHKRSGKYESNARSYGKNVYLGLYDSKEEAFESYRVAKESYVKKKAEEYREYLPDEVYKALILYRVQD